jgi:protein-tyrosine phosphatase
MNILFVCTGNICLSPAAETVLKFIIKNNELSDSIHVSSRGLIDYHVGEKADGRMKKYALKRGYEIKTTAKQFDPTTDFEHFDYIVAMDDDNLAEMDKLDPKKQYADKIHTMTAFSQKPTHYDHIPDPYYSPGNKGFVLVMDLLEDACQGLFLELQKKADDKS